MIPFSLVEYMNFMVSWCVLVLRSRCLWLPWNLKDQWVDDWCQEDLEQSSQEVQKCQKDSFPHTEVSLRVAFIPNQQAISSFWLRVLVNPVTRMCGDVGFLIACTFWIGKAYRQHLRVRKLRRNVKMRSPWPKGQILIAMGWGEICDLPTL